MSEHARDTQAEAFRHAGPEDWIDDDELGRWHERGSLVTVTGQPVRTPEDFEGQGWDEGRVGIPSLDEAKAALAARVESPQAPDDDASAYDHLDPADYPGRP